MGRRRGEQGRALAGAGAPASYFRRVLTEASEWSAGREQLEERRIAAARAEARSSGQRMVDWISALRETVAPSQARLSADGVRRQ
jgi:penicillin-binding protein 1A